MLDIIKKILLEKSDDIIFAYLFGSYAQNRATKKSDIDIAVYLKNKTLEFHFDIKTQLYLDLSKNLKRDDLDIVILNSCKNIILLSLIITHGKLIFNQDESVFFDYEQKILHKAIDFKHQRRMAMGI